MVVWCTWSKLGCFHTDSKCDTSAFVEQDMNNIEHNGNVTQDQQSINLTPEQLETLFQQFAAILNTEEKRQVEQLFHVKLWTKLTHLRYLQPAKNTQETSPNTKGEINQHQKPPTRYSFPILKKYKTDACYVLVR